jgi:hypothetical protein
MWHVAEADAIQYSIYMVIVLGVEIVYFFFKIRVYVG